MGAFCGLFLGIIGGGVPLFRHTYIYIYLHLCICICELYGVFVGLRVDGFMFRA